MFRPLPLVRPRTLDHLTRGSGTTVTLRSTLTHEPLGTASVCTPADILGAVAEARLDAGRWGYTPRPTRVGILRHFVRLIRAEREALMGLAQHACGLSIRDAAADLRSATSLLERMTGRGVGRYRLSVRRQAAAVPDAVRVVATRDHEARPFTALLEGALPALAGGSGVLTETCEHTAVTTAHVIALARHAGLPTTAWRPLLGNGADAHALLTEHTDGYRAGCCPSRCGSDRSGPRTARALLAVRHDARMSAAVRSALRSCFAAAGRSCTSSPLVVVHTRLVERFTEEFTRAAAHTPVQSPLAPASVLSALADEAQVGALRSYVEATHTRGGEILHDGGHRPETAPWLHGPVVLSYPDVGAVDPAGVPPGPVAVIVPFDAWAEVLRLSRDTNRHVRVHTATDAAQLMLQFAGLPADDIQVNRTVRRPPPRRPGGRDQRWTEAGRVCR
ncbi:aldehyde dehydrogenase family protein [Streptomyces sp. NPDC059166]|uniref:aldehyde dehydrogenase family protein n=1 Tax=Streptomyces sp. NPDC059166 TaxID=3346752 RepID=UPI0036AB877A